VRCGPARSSGTVGAAGGVVEAGDADADGGGAAGGDLIHLSELGPGSGQADFQALGLAEPVVCLGLGDPGGQPAPRLGTLL
jgi:hypothetical protein